MGFITNGGGGGGGAISGVTVTGTAAAGQVPVASSSSAGAWANPPGFEFGYDQITVGVNVASTTEATPTTIITCGAHTFDGGAVMAHFFCAAVTGATASFVVVNLWEGATNLGQLAVVSGISASNQIGVPVSAHYRFTPTAASHSYLIQAFCGSTTGTPAITAGAAGAGNHVPTFVRFTKV